MGINLGNSACEVLVRRYLKVDKKKTDREKIRRLLEHPCIFEANFTAVMYLQLGDN